MSDFTLTSIQAPPPIAAVSQIERPTAPKPPKAQSDHKPLNPATSSRGPAVVLSGALAKAPERQGQQAPRTPPATGQRINHVI
jgi:hypothetical protein